MLKQYKRRKPAWISRVSPHLAVRETFKRSRTPWRVKPEGTFSIYASYAGIFNHRSMEKDKLSILDVWGAYGQKDIKILDRSEINKPARGPYAMVREARRISFSWIYANYAGIFNHRSMEKDKLSILDVWGAYGQNDIKILDRSEIENI